MPRQRWLLCLSKQKQNDMKNDLTEYEKILLRVINFKNGTNYNYRHLMEWSNSKSRIEKNLRDGEIIYDAFDCFVAINPNPKNNQ